MEVDAVHGDKGKKGKSNKSKKGKDKGKGKHRNKQENNAKFEGYCGHCGKWERKQKDCRYRNTLAEVDEEEYGQHPSGRLESLLHILLVCLQQALIRTRQVQFPR